MDEVLKEGARIDSCMMFPLYCLTIVDTFTEPPRSVLCVSHRENEPAFVYMFDDFEAGVEYAKSLNRKQIDYTNRGIFYILSEIETFADLFLRHEQILAGTDGFLFNPIYDGEHHVTKGVFFPWDSLKNTTNTNVSTTLNQ